MTRHSSERLSLILAIISAALGVLVPFWPLLILSILLLASGGRLILALAFGILLDIAFGVPTGMFAPLYFPFTVVALLAALGMRLGARFMIDRYSRYTL